MSAIPETIHWHRVEDGLPEACGSSIEGVIAWAHMPEGPK